MNKLFIPYELALALRELGFNEECLGCYYQATEHVARDYHKREDVVYNEGSPIKFTIRENYLTSPYEKVVVKAPLWGQAFDWFREHLLLEGLILPQDKSGLDPLPLYFIAIESYKNGDWVEIFNSTNESTLLHYSDHYDARQACLEKLIEIVENGRN